MFERTVPESFSSPTPAKTEPAVQMDLIDFSTPASSDSPASYPQELQHDESLVPLDHDLLTDMLGNPTTQDPAKTDTGDNETLIDLN